MRDYWVVIYEMTCLVCSSKKSEKKSKGKEAHPTNKKIESRKHPPVQPQRKVEAKGRQGYGGEEEWMCK